MNKRTPNHVVGAPLVGALRKDTHEGCPYGTRWAAYRPLEHLAPPASFLREGSSQERLPGGCNGGGDEGNPKNSTAANYPFLGARPLPGNRRLRERVRFCQKLVRRLWQPRASGAIDGRPGNSGARGAVTSGSSRHQERDGRSFPRRAPIEALSGACTRLSTSNIPA